MGNATGATSITGGAASSLTLGSNSTVNIGSNSTVNMGNNRVGGVAAGVLGTDAVNVNQLNNSVQSLQNSINANNLVATRGIAGVSAVASLPALDTGKNFNFGVGVGSYSGASALAIGAQARIYETIVLKVTGSQSTSGGVGTFGAGVGWSF